MISSCWRGSNVLGIKLKKRKCFSPHLLEPVIHPNAWTFLRPKLSMPSSLNKYGACTLLFTTKNVTSYSSVVCALCIKRDGRKYLLVGKGPKWGPIHVCWIMMCIWYSSRSNDYDVGLQPQNLFLGWCAFCVFCKATTNAYLKVLEFHRRTVPSREPVISIGSSGWEQTALTLFACRSSVLTQRFFCKSQICINKKKKKLQNTVLCICAQQCIH